MATDSLYDILAFYWRRNGRGYPQGLRNRLKSPYSVVIATKRTSLDSFQSFDITTGFVNNALMRILSAAKRTALDLLFPTSCVGCGEEESLFCAKCRSGLWRIPPTCLVCRKLVPTRSRVPAGRTCSTCQKKSFIYAFLSPFSYDEPLIREAIHALKYHRILAWDTILAGFLRDYIQRFRILLPREAAVVPIPLHKSRERVRGFNQAELIARVLSEMLNLRLEAGALEKVNKTRPQIELSGAERRENVVGTFAVRYPERVKDKVVILLDDVKTTGATLEEAAKVLKRAGAKRVWAITVAH